MASDVPQFIEVLDRTYTATGNEMQFRVLCNDVFIQFNRWPLQQPVFSYIGTKNLLNTFIQVFLQEIIDPDVCSFEPSAHGYFFILHIGSQQELLRTIGR